MQKERKGGREGRECRKKGRKEERDGECTVYYYKVDVYGTGNNTGDETDKQLHGKEWKEGRNVIQEWMERERDKDLRRHKQNRVS